MNKNAKILLVEDNEGDIVLTIEALKDAKAGNTVVVVRDGEEAMQFLLKQGQYINAETPDIILLDINLPKMNGKEVLEEIKKNERLKIIPVIMLTTSNSEKDILDSYRNHANCYVTKSSDFQKFMEIVSMIVNFWLRIVQLPNKKLYE
jgi:chemotaxis family two-component system response regulator Rcp1